MKPWWWSPEWYVPTVDQVGRAQMTVRANPVRWPWFPTLAKGNPPILVPLPTLARLTPLPD